MESKTKATLLLFVVALAIPMISSSPCEASLVDNGDGTVTQTMADGSRLMWLKDANLAATTGYPAYGSDLGGEGMSFDDCIAWVATLNAGGGFAGHTDWRMPTALNPDGSGPFAGFFAFGGTGEMIFLSFTEGIWFNAPNPPGTGPFINMKSNYWTGTSGTDVDDGFWNSVTGSSSQSVLQSKLKVVGPNTSVPRRFSAWAVRDMEPVPTGIGDVIEPRTLALHPARPNPFNPSTIIAFDVPTFGHVQLDIFDVRGRHVRSLVDEALNAGSHHVRWNGDNDDGFGVASGVYFARLSMGGGGHAPSLRKLLLAK